MYITALMTHLKERFDNYKKTKSFIVNTASTIFPDLSYTPKGEVVHFKHSGLLGDVIYSIPAMYALANGKKIALHLNINAFNSMRKELRHPNGKKMLTEKSIELLKSLLLSQEQFTECDIFECQLIDFDLDMFSRIPFDFRMGSITRWYFLAFGVNFDTSKPWLFAKSDSEYKDYIIIARSLRYRTPSIDYSFLSQYPKVAFIGVEDEYQDMKQFIANLEYIKVGDFLELARIISGCRFFIGNQSAPFALAEALKVKRILEVYPFCPNVIVEGKDGYDFCYQKQLETIVHKLFIHS